MWLKSQSKVSILLKALIFLEIHLTFARAAFWVGPLSGDCCWTPELEVKSKEMSSDLMCAFYCISNICDSYYFSSGLCKLSYPSMFGMKDAWFKRWKATGETREVARNKSASGSLEFTINYWQNAVDGKTSTKYHSARDTAQPWFLVDLENNFWVSKVRFLLLTQATYNQRTANIKILLGTSPPPAELDFSQYTEVGYIGEPLEVGAAWQEYEVSPPLCSRYAVVMKSIPHDYDKNLIVMYELEVYAAF